MTRAEMKVFTRKFLRENQGVTAIEYALIAGLIAVVIAGSVTDVANKLTTVFSSIVNAL
jgi:pilus assembly protein Flp/PilA